MNDGEQRHLLRCSSPAEPVVGGQKVLLCLRRERLRLHDERPAAAQNALEGRLTNSQFLGDHTDCRVKVGSREVRVKGEEGLALSLGQEVHLSFSPDDCLLLAPAGS